MMQQSVSHLKPTGQVWYRAEKGTEMAKSSWKGLFYTQGASMSEDCKARTYYNFKELKGCF